MCFRQNYKKQRERQTLKKYDRPAAQMTFFVVFNLSIYQLLHLGPPPHIFFQKHETGH